MIQLELENKVRKKILAEVIAILVLISGVFLKSLGTNFNNVCHQKHLKSAYQCILLSVSLYVLLQAAKILIGQTDRFNCISYTV